MLPKTVEWQVLPYMYFEGGDSLGVSRFPLLPRILSLAEQHREVIVILFVYSI